MVRRALWFLLLAGASLAEGPRLKDLFDPDHGDFPLRPYGWSDWEKLDRDTKFRSQGVDPSAWVDPPPDPPDPEEEKRKAEEEEKKKEAEKKKDPNAPKEYPQDRHPGFHFDKRLAHKQQVFEQLVQPASSSMLEGLVKQLKALEKSTAKFEKRITEVTEDFLQVKEMYEKAVQPQIDQAIKKTGKPPSVVMVSRALKQDLEKKSRALQEILSLQQSEGQFLDWMLDRILVLLSQLSDDERRKPINALEKGIADKDWSYRIRCARLLGGLPDPDAVASFSKAMESEKDPLVLGELVRIRARRGGDGLLELLTRRLEDTDWPVRAAIIRELGALRRKEAVDLLIAQLGKEEGRLKDDITRELRKLSGQNFEPEHEPWRIWWEKVREGWTPPPTALADADADAAKEGSVYFYGIRTSSRRIIFCIDTSGSMAWPLDGENGKKAPRIETAKRELLQALTMLPEETRFNIVSYSATVETWKPRMQDASSRSKQAARKYVEALQPSSATNIYDALETCLRLTLGDGKRKASEEPEADTIFFMTDGQPTNGRIVDPNQILEAITSQNRLLGVVIHTVGVSKEQNAGFLLNLARQNQGRYVAHK